jgi:hypothetical protein
VNHPILARTVPPGQCQTSASSAVHRRGERVAGHLSSSDLPVSREEHTRAIAAILDSSHQRSFASELRRIGWQAFGVKIFRSVIDTDEGRAFICAKCSETILADDFCLQDDPEWDFADAVAGHLDSHTPEHSDEAVVRTRRAA